MKLATHPQQRQRFPARSHLQKLTALPPALQAVGRWLVECPVSRAVDRDLDDLWWPKNDGNELQPYGSVGVGTRTVAHPSHLDKARGTAKPVGLFCNSSTLSRRFAQRRRFPARPEDNNQFKQGIRRTARETVRSVSKSSNNHALQHD
jgi:hypothetical protein